MSGHEELGQREHERLCGYVFGELTEAERADVERELARSPALRAEHAKLVRTLEVVGAAGSEPLALSEPAREELVAAVGGARDWNGRATLRLAAAAGIAAAALVVIRLARPGDRDVGRAERLHLADGTAPACAPEAAAALQTQLAATTPPTAQPTRPEAIYIGRFGSKPGVSVIDLNSFGQTQAPGVSSFSGTLDRTSGLGAYNVPNLGGFGGASGFDAAGTALSWAPHPNPPPLVFPPLSVTPYSGGVQGALLIPPLQPGMVTIAGVADGGLCGNPSVVQIDAITRMLSEQGSAAACDSILAACRATSGETPRDMYFRFWGDNPFVEARADRLSTFAIDQDTASYTLARSYLNQNQLPPPASVRTEEFVNAFRPYVEPPQNDALALTCELAPSRFPTADPASVEFAPQQRWTLACNVRGRDVVPQERARMNLTFVVDVSGSMREGNRLDLVKHALGLLAGELFATDTVSLVTFSTEARVVLPPTAMANRAALESALSELSPDGGTNAEAGLVLGYAQAEAMLDPQANNRVVLCSDGVANIGATEQGALSERVKASREKGILLNTIGVGMGNLNDALLEQLADRGDGVCRYVDSAQEAKKVMVDELTGTLETIARDVKLQVEFDPAYVLRWRQVGYENRAVADADFRNDKVDAGEAQAGRQTTALYELDLGGAIDGDPVIGTLRARWQPVRRGGAPQERALPIRISDAAWTFGAASAGFRRSALVAQAAEVLRGSVHARGDSIDALVEECERLAPELSDPAFYEFVELVRRARELLNARYAAEPELQRLIDALRENSVRRQALEQAARDRQQLDELQRRSSELEAQIRQLLEALQQEPAQTLKLGYSGSEGR
ncbi:MAG: DUF3520 domain-containing protein [Planctomycetota bacterium]|nr:MAG: DUF3520 domain-containing protein [Planctomycetota bacterium]